MQRNTFEKLEQLKGFFSFYIQDFQLVLSQQKNISESELLTRVESVLKAIFRDDAPLVMPVMKREEKSSLDLPKVLELFQQAFNLLQDELCLTEGGLIRFQNNLMSDLLVCYWEGQCLQIKPIAFPMYQKSMSSSMAN